ncbi:hypothetical protein BH11BAC1_BH11BAC1_23100 [soil metagenome]
MSPFREILFCVGIICSLSGFSQQSKRDNLWMLCEYGYDNAGIDFNSGTADTLSVYRQMGFFITNASICDTNGQLLFYTNGNLICNRFHNYMPNTGGFNPGYHNSHTIPYGQGINQGALIIPRPSNADEFVIFHESADTFISHNEFFERPINLSYSVINMNLSGGNGDLTSEKNIHVIDDTLVNGRLTACKHANGRDWWIITHRLFSNDYYKILMTPDTIVQYSMQAIGSTTQFSDAMGAAIFSKDGNKFIQLNYDTTIDILDFDRCTGDFSNLVSFGIPDSNLATLGCALSENGRYLYVSTNYHIFQFDTWAANIPASRLTVSTWDGTANTHGFWTSFFYMRLAPDGKIYISTREGTNEFHVIDYPDSAGVACNVRQHGMLLPSYNAFSMPNAVNYSLGAIPGSICDTVYYLRVPIDNKKDYSINIFPNPAGNMINISCSQRKEHNPSFQITDLMGNLILIGKIKSPNETIPINTSDFPSGIYFVRVQVNDDTVLSYRFVIAR